MLKRDLYFGDYTTAYYSLVSQQNYINDLKDKVNWYDGLKEIGHIAPG